MAYVPRKGKSPDTIHKIRDELDTMLAGYESRTMQREAGLRNEELSEAASPGHVRATALVKQLQSDDVGDVESAVDQLVNLVQYMDIRKAMFDAGAIELLVALLQKYLDTQHPIPLYIPYHDRPYRGIISLLHYFASDSSVSCYHYTDRIAEAGAIPQLLVLLRDLGEVMALQTVTETVGVLEILAKRHEVDFNCIERLVSLIREGTSYTMYGYTIDHDEAAYMLYYLARNNPDRQEEKAHAEGARDRNDAIAAVASVAAASESERADEQGTNAMFLHTQKSELQRLVSDAANALLDSDADVPTKEVDDDATPFYYMLESHRDDGKQTVLWNVEADRAMTLAEGIAWIQNNRPNKRQRRR